MRLKPRRGRASPLALLCLLYAGFILTWYGLDWTPVAYWWPYKLTDLFNVWLYLPLVPLALLALLGRNRRAGTWLLVPVVVFLVDYGAFFTPSPPSPDGEPLRVVSANVLTVNDEPAALGEALLRERPDVIAVQELSAPLARALEERLGERYPYRALYPNSRGAGLGVLSRYPIVLDEAPEIGHDDCHCQRVVIDFAGRRVTVLNSHPTSPDVAVRRVGSLPLPRGFTTAETERAVDGLLRKAAGAEHPLLILGDLNTSDRQPTYHLLRDRFHDAYREAGWGFGYTFPSASALANPSARVYRLAPIPFVRIDYVLHDDAWATHSARTIELPGSDHRGVAANLILRR